MLASQHRHAFDVARKVVTVSNGSTVPLRKLRDYVAGQCRVGKRLRMVLPTEDNRTAIITLTERETRAVLVNRAPIKVSGRTIARATQGER